MAVTTIAAPTIAERVATARILAHRGSRLSATICARWAGIALRESGLDPEFAVNPFEDDDESDLAHAFAAGLAEGRRPPRPVQAWTPIPGCTHAAHAAAQD